VRAGESFKIAIRAILANGLRSALTMLGILIGVGAVIMLVAVGNGSSVAVQKQIQSLGTNTLIVNRQAGFGPGGRTRTGTISRGTDLTVRDVSALRDRTANPDIKAVAPALNAQSVTAAYQGATYSPAQFIGTSAEYAEIRNYKVASGTFFTNDDVAAHAKVVVLGQTVVTNLFGTGADPIGANVKFGNVSLQVIGMLAPKGTNGAQDQDDVAMAPITTVQDSFAGASTSLNNITIEAKSRKVMDAAAAEVTATLLGTHRITNGVPDFSVLNQGTLLQTSSSTNRVFTVLLGAVAAISLLVGGIGVMNIMLVTVTERTREIGIRKAIGATKSDILMQFLVEAVLLSLLGGLVGVAAGLVGSHFKVVGVTPVVAPYSVFLAFGVAVVVGLFFGIYPANRAASLRPIEALRYE
jgi:putative ABC transport system permease protein